MLFYIIEGISILFVVYSKTPENRSSYKAETPIFRYLQLNN